ncbi:unnamed protein product [Cuscuta campestris]|uniref:RING-type E3 ubiquitin transferase n=1 Tax=Cuscuta campestris TaxID=132261 RepID=A0A484LEH3_9ASTE|nr:unnamed protein product [Cuscuta campestris]
MGGCCCCCASKEEEPNRTSQFYHYPRGSEERQPLSHHGAALVLSTGRPRTPPGNQDTRKSDATAQIKNTESGEETNSGNRATSECDAKAGDNIDLTALNVVVDELEKSEYDEENPKIITKCEHHFHLACIFEWMERSDTCPVCDQEMVFSA